MAHKTSTLLWRWSLWNLISAGYATLLDCHLSRIAWKFSELRKKVNHYSRERKKGRKEGKKEGREGRREGGRKDGREGGREKERKRDEGRKKEKKDALIFLKSGDAPFFILFIWFLQSSYKAVSFTFSFLGLFSCLWHKADFAVSAIKTINKKITETVKVTKCVQEAQKAELIFCTVASL